MRFLLLLAALGCCASLAAQSPPTVAITHVAVVDVAGGRLLPDRTVLLRDEVIEAVGPAQNTRVPAGASIVDGRDGFLIPGLWDMHTHLSYARPSALPVLIANGVTYVRDLGSVLAEVDVWRGEIAAGVRVGPVIMRSGPIVNGQEFNRYQLAITNASDASATVRALVKTGVDLIKLHRRTPREAYFAVLAQAKQLSVPVAGHVPMTVSPEEASNAGQQTIEHIDTLFEGTFSAALNGAPLASAIRAWRQTPDAAALFETFVRNGTVVDATLMNAFRINAFLENPDDPRDKYFAASGLRESNPEAYRQRSFELSVAGYFADPARARDLTPFRVVGRVQQSVWGSLGDFDLRSSLGAVEVPSLIVHGRQDPIPLASSEAAAEALRSRLVVLENCGHVPYVEQSPSLFDALREFLTANRPEPRGHAP